MRAISILPVFASLFVAACVQERTFSQQEVAARIDSIVATRIADEKIIATEQLDRRRSIEVKQKADSIIASRQAMLPTPEPATLPKEMPAPINPAP